MRVISALKKSDMGRSLRMTDDPKTAKTGDGENHSANKPRRGELFTRTAGGSVQLKQTAEMFGKVKK